MDCAMQQLKHVIARDKSVCEHQTHRNSGRTHRQWERLSDFINGGTLTSDQRTIPQCLSVTFEGLCANQACIKNR